MAIACFRLFTVLPLLPDLSVPLFLRRIALPTCLEAALPYFRRPERFRVAISYSSVLMLSYVFPDRLARVVPENQRVDRAVAVHLNLNDMSSRTGMEAEAITRLTDGLQPPALRAILVQCLTGELAPSAAISQLLAVEGASIVRAAIDEVTHRAATISRASDTMVRDRVDELTQIFIEQVTELADVRDGTMSRTGPGLGRQSRPSGSGDRDESRAD
jgi:hypothetical protein